MSETFALAAPEAEVLYERVCAHVALVTLNRPSARNAFNGPMSLRLGSIAREIEADPTVRAAVITARGPVFSAGLDLKCAAEGDLADVVDPEAGFAGFVYARRTKPWIAALQGTAHGGGTEIALSCDMIVAGPSVSFALPEVRWGMIAGAGGSFRIARSLPRAVALEMVTTGEPLGAERAFALGLINRLVGKGEEQAEALRMAKSIAANSPIGVRESLWLTRAACDHAEVRLRTMQDEAVARIFASPDYREGLRAFAERRGPVWSSEMPP